MTTNRSNMMYSAMTLGLLETARMIAHRLLSPCFRWSFRHVCFGNLQFLRDLENNFYLHVNASPQAFANRTRKSPAPLLTGVRPDAGTRLCYTILLAGLLTAAGSALAQTEQERPQCEGEDGATLTQRIDGCSSVIKAARDKGEKLAEYFNLRGVAYRLKGDLDRAIQDYNQAIKLNGKFAMAYNNRGVAYDRKGEFEHAIQDYEQAIKLKPSPEAYFNRGNAYLAKAQYDHAIDDFNQAIKLKADFAPAYDNRCWARAVVGILKQALADCNEALRLMPNHAATHDSRGFIFLKRTQFDAAVSDYDAALRIDPKLAFALYGRGLAKLKSEDPAGAIDIAAAKALQADIAQEYLRYGIQEAR
jgi:tetratricopeptide (TPR) repeat protein